MDDIQSIPFITGKTIIGGSEAKGPVEEIIKIWPWSSGWEQLQQIYQ
jgi:hypothetical protein